MQLAGKSAAAEGPATAPLGMLATFRHRVSTMGVLSLWAGAPAVVARALSYSAIRLGAYGPAKDLVGAGERPSMARKIMAGCISGSAASFAANPVEVLKVSGRVQ